MKKTFKHLDIDVEEEVLDNGLRVFICPMDRHEAMAKITTLYGSKILEFKPQNKDEYMKIPAGTAHFLEHKMFAKEDSEDIMNLFQQNGAMSNAYTNAHVTSYYFSSPTKFLDNLKTLLDLVTKPYYTEKNVAAEMGIIDQEIKAGFDNPEEMAYYTTIYNTFAKTPYRYPVGGYSESIKKITPEILYDCYHTFYHPSNMILTISGNVPKETMEFIKNYYAKIDYQKQKPIQIKKYEEPANVYKDKEIVYRDVTNNILEHGFKVSIKDIDMPLFKIREYLKIYLIIKFGSISKFNKKCFENKNILTAVSHYVDINDDYIFIDFDTKVMEVKDIFDQIYTNLNDKNFTEEDFNLTNKNNLKNTILLSENVDSINGIIDYHVQKYGKVLYDIYDLVKSLNYKEGKKLIDNLDFTHDTRTIITKKPE